MIFTATNATTEQEVFDFSVEHMAKQGKPSIKSTMLAGSASSICAYRGDNGAMCAAGPFLPDDLARKYESTAIATVLKNEPQLLLEPFERLLTELQTAHDTMRDDFDLRHRLRQIAANRKLKDNIVETITEWEI